MITSSFFRICYLGTCIYFKIFTNSIFRTYKKKYKVSNMIKLFNIQNDDFCSFVKKKRIGIDVCSLSELKNFFFSQHFIQPQSPFPYLKFNPEKSQFLYKLSLLLQRRNFSIFNRSKEIRKYLANCESSSLSDYSTPVRRTEWQNSDVSPFCIEIKHCIFL